MHHCIRRRLILPTFEHVILKMIRSAIVTEQSPPLRSRLADWYRDTDLLDSFATKLPASSSGDIRGIAHAILGQPAPWFIRTPQVILGRLRRHARLGKSADHDSANHDQDRISFLPVLSADDEELILGRDDRHMSFRISLMIQKSIEGPNLVSLTTAVRCNTRLGNVYLAAIKPFHRLVVPSNLHRAAGVGFVLTDRR